MKWKHTGPLCGEFTGHRLIPLTKASDAELWCCLWSVPEQTDKQSRRWWFETPLGSLWRHCCNNLRVFLLDRPWISPWIKSISNELDITCHVFASQLSGHCDVIADRLWRHQQNVMRANESRGLCVKTLVSASFMNSLCRVRNKIMYVLLWRTVYALTRVLFWCLFPLLLRNSGNKHQNNPLVSA